MFTTAIAILGAVALLSPGFLIVEFSDARRARARRSDLELSLRALVYSVLVHLVFCWWTAWLVRRVGDVGSIDDHLAAVVAYLIVVLIGAPIVAGVAIGAYLFRVECTGGPPGFLASAFGAGQATDAFDFAFQRHRGGLWVVVELVGGSAGAPRYAGGLFGKRSAVGQTPAPHDIYLENVARVDVDQGGTPFLVSLADPPYSLYIPAERIVRILVLRTEDGSIRSETMQRPRGGGWA